jgi:hypothetical protein
MVAAVTAVAAVVSRESFRFPSLVAGNNLNLSERWDRWEPSEQVSNV